jgi:hypothetical protein
MDATSMCAIVRPHGAGINRQAGLNSRRDE